MTLNRLLRQSVSSPSVFVAFNRDENWSKTLNRLLRLSASSPSVLLLRLQSWWDLVDDLEQVTSPFGFFTFNLASSSSGFFNFSPSDFSSFNFDLNQPSIEDKFSPLKFRDESFVFLLLITSRREPSPTFSSSNLIIDVFSTIYEREVIYSDPSISMWEGHSFFLFSSNNWLSDSIHLHFCILVIQSTFLLSVSIMNYYTSKWEKIPHGR